MSGSTRRDPQNFILTQDLFLDKASRIKAKSKRENQYANINLSGEQLQMKDKLLRLVNIERVLE